MVKVELGWGEAESFKDSETPKKLRAKVKLRGVPEPGTKVTFHFLAIADCLVKWQKWPRIPEGVFKKSICKGKQRHEPSCKNPNHYANRMLAGLDYYFNKDNTIGSLTGL